MWKILARSLSSQTPKSLIERELYQGNSVVRLILNDGKVNALSLAMVNELHDELCAINKIDKVRSVIIAHHGPAFSAGHQIKELTTASGSGTHNKIFERCGDMMMLIQKMKVPVIAEVNGTAAAAGCQLVAACDLVVAGNSSKFLVPGQKIAVPRKVALDMLLTGEPIDAQAALRAGLVSRLVEDCQVKFEALKVAERIGAHSRSVTALGKAFFYAQVELNTADAYRYGAKVMAGNLKMQDCQEGIDAFLTKRHPEFTGSEALVKDSNSKE
ncbi:unnamed protein product [Caenorhabditis auriculariae]|uniref:Enoyl-CoA hydratase domain-containing protein 3, mitochondrial n=1 Tax=Caenorhabditis auriculariae TaxID=2777116 RepID=A0A8S1HDH4_9PELO|nr:unnamed protein product [Caenorhabditis auriculariae]